MSIQEIEQAVTNLTPKELARFANGSKSLMRKIGISNSKQTPKLASLIKLLKKPCLNIALVALRKYEIFRQSFILGIARKSSKCHLGTSR